MLPPPLRERLRDMWLCITMGGDPVATCYTAVAVALALGMFVLYSGLAKSVWQWWLR